MERIKGHRYSFPTLITILTPGFPRAKDIFSHVLVLPIYFSSHGHKLYTSVKTKQNKANKEKTAITGSWTYHSIAYLICLIICHLVEWITIQCIIGWIIHEWHLILLYISGTIKRSLFNSKGLKCSSLSRQNPDLVWLISSHQALEINYFPYLWVTMIKINKLSHLSLFNKIII